MKPTNPVLRLTPTSGFTLVEMAIVLAIVALLLGGLLPVISAQVEQQRRNETRKQMEEIKEALIGYAMINGTLPCPTIENDPASANYGIAQAACPSDVAADGYLPWRTLGVAETDAWGSKRSDISSPWTGYWRYRVDRKFAVSFTLGTGFTSCSGPLLDCLTIRDNNGVALTTTSERPVAIVFSTGPNVTADGRNAKTDYEATDGIYQSDVPRADDQSTIGINEEFDDIMIWISRPQLFNRMVTAGKLP